eukprot:7750600-Alexandrium_andersonii.AAC.1
MEKHSEAINVKRNQQRQSLARSKRCCWATSELGNTTTLPALASFPWQQDAKVTAAAAARTPGPMRPGARRRIRSVDEAPG